MKDFGPYFRYNKTFLGTRADGRIVMIEEFVAGTLIQYINNKEKIIHKRTP